MRFIAIDPDTSKSGVAFIDTDTREMSVKSLSFCEIIFSVLADKKDISCVAIEGGWLNDKSVFHSYANARTAGFIGKSVGRNHETGRKLVEVCEYLNIRHIVVKPFLKCWKGRDRKITHDELKKLARQYRISFEKKRTNQDERDACLIAIMTLT